jgi:hypothetical protein
MVKAFFEDDYAVIEFDETIPCVKVTLRGVPRSSEHYQQVQAKRLELMAREIGNYPKLHMLTDSSTAGPVLDEDINYFRDVVMPAMEKAGVRYLAIVVPTNKFTQLTIREMTQEVEVMKVRYFDALRDAKQWLRRMTVL